LSVTDDTGVTPEDTARVEESSTTETPTDTPETGGESIEGLRLALKAERDARKSGDKRARTLETRLRELEDRDKSEAEKLAARAADSDRRASEAEAMLLRLEVGAEHSLPADAVQLLHGTTREEIETSAQRLVAFAASTAKPPPASFDGGARVTPAAEKSPEQAHNDFLLRVFGREPRPG
jgi:hypothetical protein